MSTILVVDDDPFMRHYLEGLLTKQGYRTLLAENGEQGVFLASAEKPDIILMDLYMPAKTGIEAVKDLKKRLGEKCPPVVIITGMEYNGIYDQMCHAGVDAYFTKPITPANLFNRIEKLLAG